MENKRIAIIGAGISGLLACKYTMEMGFKSVVVFEARSGIGGVWSQTIESTKLQSPKHFYQFSDFAWPSSVKETFPDHNQVMEYLQSYAHHFNILPLIKFNSRVVGIDYFTPSSDEDMLSSNLWGGSGEPFSPAGKWNVTVQDTRCPSVATEVYQVDFVILCIGTFSDLPFIPDFPVNRGPQLFDGQVMHSMDYAALGGGDRAAEFIKGKWVTVVGCQKSAVDLAVEVATRNGVKHPCTLLFRSAHWAVPAYFQAFIFQFLNRFTELMVHKPHEGIFLWLIALLLSPLLWIYEKLVENYLKWMYPLKKYNMVPDHGYIKHVSSCMNMILPAKFYDRVKEGSLILKKSQSFSFCENGLIVDGEAAPLITDIVILATGYKTDEKLKNIFSSTYFKECIMDSSLPFYRECIHPHIPQLAILGYSDSPAVLFTTEMRTRWLVHFLAGKFKLPNIREMENDVMEWEKCVRKYAGESYKRNCPSVLLQIYCNDQLCRDMGCNPRRKSWFLPELLAPYGPTDYTYLIHPLAK